MKIAEIQVHDVIWYDNFNGKEISASVTFYGPDDSTRIISVPVNLPYQLDLTLKQVEELAIATAKGTLKAVANTF
ncbi:hypothetical protein [Citrobacter braakii]|uniref:hypothetical protein n=1 Tax=Citrobacter braakii TaxID=57706 RepID=UPI0011EC47DE|nr:hypothetical protein [Citrobacter braakii]HAT7506959.1 hypothetical protein [Citrobacter braakii]